MSKGKKLTAVDLFSGPGGFSLGLRMAGFDVLGAIDVNPNAILTYRRNHPKTHMVGEDITSLSPRVFLKRVGLRKGSVDLLVGSPPCRSFSHANRQLGNSDIENDLVKAFCRFVSEIKPKAMLMENVPGILSSRCKNFIDEVLSDFESSGYELTVFELKAEEYGVPQLRRRVFFASNIFEEKTKRPPISHGEDAKNDCVSVRDAIIGDIPRIDFSTKKEIFDYPNGPTTEYQKQIRRHSRRIHNHVITKSGRAVKERYSRIPRGGNWRDVPDRYLGIKVMHSCLYKRLDPKMPSITVANFRKSMIVHPTQNRGLSVREAARLQSFPDRYVFLGGISSMQQQVGDAVPPLLAEAMCRATRRLLED